jgi:uncharacterized alkaline shock family protein YloU
MGRVSTSDETHAISHVVADSPGSSAIAATDDLAIDDGTITVSGTVVAKIAALAAREVTGVHSLGVGAARSVTSVRDRIPGSVPSPTTGVSVEVGRTQAAVDLDIVVEYGIPITQIARDVRRRVISSVEQMTGLQVVEVNITVDDVNLPPLAEPQGKRLQ